MMNTVVLQLLLGSLLSVQREREREVDVLCPSLLGGRVRMDGGGFPWYEEITSTLFVGVDKVSKPLFPGGDICVLQAAGTYHVVAPVCCAWSVETCVVANFRPWLKGRTQQPHKKNMTT